MLAISINWISRTIAPLITWVARTASITWVARVALPHQIIMNAFVCLFAKSFRRAFLRNTRSQLNKRTNVNIMGIKISNIYKEKILYERRR